ncbi:MAG TPA: hypothetical protein VHH73_18930, partial [Verrucomicrobiae bacterium]|nr:hypothetical protein [Verrucomicrobiae bacterium]
MGSLYRYSSAALGRLRIYADWRCLEPVVVFESDDWGLKRRSCAAQLAQYGIPRDWADEDSETEEDLERLYSTLEAHRDALGRAPSIVANFVVANPDFDAIVRGGFQWYFEIPIDQEKSLRKKWLEGMERKVFFPQYHARYHFSVERWLDDLQKDVPGARAL